MATCILNLYSGTKLRPEKNYIFDGGVKLYLDNFTPYVISDFQYQRFELEKKIRVDLGQSYATADYSETKYDYCSFAVTGSYGTLYFYFITKITQVAASTIELELKMDTLNTFKYSTSVIPYTNNIYTLHRKTLVKREHKDRFSVDSVLEAKDIRVDTPTYVIPLTRYLINGARIVEFVSGDHYATIGTGTGLNKTAFDIEVLDSNGKILEEWEGMNFFRVYDISSTGFSFEFTDNDGVSRYIDLEANQNIGIRFTHVSTLSADTNACMSLLWDLFVYYEARFIHKRIVNPYQEGFNTILFKKNEQMLLDRSGDSHWYLVYASANNVVQNPNDTAATYVNPIDVRFYCDNGFSLVTTSATTYRLYATDPKIPKWTNDSERVYSLGESPTSVGEQYFIVNGVTYDFYNGYWFRAKRNKNNDPLFSQVLVYHGNDTPIEYNKVAYVDVYGINNLKVMGEWWSNGAEFYIGAGASSLTVNSPAWDTLDLTDSKLIKAFAFPYAPMDYFNNGYEFDTLPENCVIGNNTIELDKIQNANFKYELQFVDVDNPQSVLFKELIVDPDIDRDIEYESKLFHSDFYQPKFVYDSFSFTFLLENVDVDSYYENYNDFKSFFVTYIISKNVLSKFAFVFNQYVTFRSTQDYENILVIDRNNEKALYNNAYINYIKSGGYNYDTKKASSQNAVNGITTALAIAGSVASFASTPVTGMAGVAGGIGLSVSASAKIVNTIYNANEQDRAIAQKINQAVMQGTSVQGNEDIDIFTAICGNKAKLCLYEVSDIMKEALLDLFYYFGYATNENKIPKTDTRVRFNYIQADIVYDYMNFDYVIAEDIKKKWSEGVTFIHKKNATTYYDPEQLKENWEKSLS